MFKLQITCKIGTPHKDNFLNISMVSLCVRFNWNSNFFSVDLSNSNIYLIAVSCDSIINLGLFLNILNNSFYPNVQRMGSNGSLISFTFAVLRFWASLNIFFRTDRPHHSHVINQLIIVLPLRFKLGICTKNGIHKEIWPRSPRLRIQCSVESLTCNNRGLVPWQLKVHKTIHSKC